MDVSQQHLSQVIQFLEQTVSLQNQNQNTQLMISYEQVLTYNDYIPCLLQIISTPQYKPLQPIACIFLRQSMSKLTVDPSAITTSILPLLVDRSVRSMASNLLSSCYSKGNAQYKFQLLQKLTSVINECNDIASIEGSLTALNMILEDDVAISARKELEPILPQIYHSIMNKLNNSNDSIREIAMSCVASSVCNMYDYEGFVQLILQRINDSSAKIRLILCQIISLLIGSFPDILKKSIKEAIHVLVTLTNDVNENVRILACGIWGELSGVYRKEISGILPSLLQLIIPRTLLTDIEIKDLGIETDDCLEGDGAVSERKQIGISLDQMSMIYGNDLIGLLLPFILEQLNSTNWKVKEAAMFVFGCIICKGWNPNNTQINTQVQVVFSLILQKMDDSPLIQYIIMWVIQRVGINIGLLLNSNEIATVFQVVVQLIKQPNPRVKFQAISVLSGFIDFEIPIIQKNHASILNLLLEHIKPPVFVGGRVIDLISQMVDVAPQLFDNNIALLKRIVQSYVQFATAFPNSPQLMESVVYNISYVLPRFGNLAAELTPSMKDFAMNILRVSDGDYQMQSSSLLLLSSCLAVNPTLAVSILNDIGLVLPKYLKILKDIMVTSSYGLLGDLITFCPNEIKPIMGEIMNSLLFVLETAQPSVLSNVLWSLGVILQKYINDMQTYYNRIYQKMILLIQNDMSQVGNNGKRNMLICLSRIGEKQPTLVAPMIGFICSNLLSSVTGLKDNEGICTVILGIGRLICFNPTSCESALNVILPIFQHSFVKYDALFEVCDAVINTLKRTFNSPQYNAIWQNYI